MSDFTPLPESEQEKEYKAILDAAADMYDDDDHRRYVWGFIISGDGGKTFRQVAGYKPPGTDWSLKTLQEIAPIASSFIIEPTAYKIAAITASAWTPEHHPVSLLRTIHEGKAGSPDIYWEAPDDGKIEHSITLDLGTVRIIGAVEISPLKYGEYHFQINTSLNPADFVIRARDYTPAAKDTVTVVIPFSYLVEDRFIQIVTDCKAITLVRVLSMSENATSDEKEMLSKQFYENRAKALRKGKA